MSDRKQSVVAVLKSFESGDLAALNIIDPTEYIQHNPNLPDGLDALAARISAIRPGTNSVQTVRVFEDGDKVFAHSIFRFGDATKVAFDIFRYENGLIVEHWDNLQDIATKPAHSMTDGPTAASDLPDTQRNKTLLANYMTDIFVEKNTAKFPAYFNGDHYIQHNPLILEDGLRGLFSGLAALSQRGLTVEYLGVKMILGEGNFVLVVNDGAFGGKPTAIYDLYRVEAGKIAEHWDVLAEIPPPQAWKNTNGKF